MSSTRKFDAAGNFRPLFKDDAFWGPYAANPVLQDFFPFGLYGGNAGWTRLPPETSGFVRWEELRHHSEFLLDLLREHYLNSLWDRSLSRGSYAPVEMVWTGTLLSVLGRSVWLESLGHRYLELLSQHDIRALLSLEAWFSQADGYKARSPFPELAAAWQGVYDDRNKPVPLDDPRVVAARADVQHMLDWARAISNDCRYAGQVLGWITDDEPQGPKFGITAMQLLAEGSGRIATTTVPAWPTFASFVLNLPQGGGPIAHDWYPTSDVSRDNWSVAEHFRWVAENRPDVVPWFIPLITAFPGNAEATKPGLPDGRPRRAELRTQIWQALAWGVKAIWGYATGGSISWAAGDGLLNVVYQPALRDSQNLLEELRDMGRDITAIGPVLLPCKPDLPFVDAINDRVQKTGEPRATLVCGDVHFPEYDGPAIAIGVLRDITPQPMGVHHTRYFLVVYNNDIRNAQAGSVDLEHLPAPLKATMYSDFNGFGVYDLATAPEPTPVQLQKPAYPGAILTFQLEPGAGRVYLLGSPCDFIVSSLTILRHRSENERAVARLRRSVAAKHLTNGVDLTTVDQHLALAELAEKAQDWRNARDAYAAAKDAVHVAIQAATPGAVRSALDQLAQTVSDGDELLRTYAGLLELPVNEWYMEGHHFLLPKIGIAIQTWERLARLYLLGEQHYRSGKLNGFEPVFPQDYAFDWLTGYVSDVPADLILLKRSDDLRAPAEKGLLAHAVKGLELARAVNEAIGAIVQQRLIEKRAALPIRKVALFTPDRDDVEYNLLYSWLHEQADTWWIAPNPGCGGALSSVRHVNGAIVGGGPQTFQPAELADFDVIWVHQLRYPDPATPDPTSTTPVDPSAMLFAELVAPATRNAIEQAVNQGRGLLLTGLAGLATLVLQTATAPPTAVETVAPDRVRQNRFYGVPKPSGNFAVGLTPASDPPHPVFDGFEATYTNGNYPTAPGEHPIKSYKSNNLVPECAWQASTPSGTVVANERWTEGSSANPTVAPPSNVLKNYAAVVEYAFGTGRILVCGGRSCDFTPGDPFVLPESHPDYRTLPANIRAFFRNCLVYLASS